MAKLIDAVEQYYKSQNWHFSKTDDENTLFVRLNLKSFQGCLVTTSADEDSYQTRANFLSKIPEDKRAAVMEFITLVNYKMYYGAFKMDLSDGELFYSYAHYCGASVPDMKLIEYTVDLPYMILDKYAPALMKLLYSGLDAKTVFAEMN